MTLEKNDRFESSTLGKHILLKIKDIDLLHNEVTIEVNKKGLKTNEKWDLEELIWSFEKGECKLTNRDFDRSKLKEPDNLEMMLVSPPCENFSRQKFQRPNKHNQAENDGAYAD